MKTNRLTRAIAVLAALYFSFAAMGHTAEAQSGTKFRLVQGTLVLIPVTINGKGPFTFVVDTGTNTTLIETGLAQELQLQATDRMQLRTAAGTQIVARGTIAEAAIGQAKAKNLEALFVQLRELKALDRNITGVLGQNFLAQFNYLLDYSRHEITFEQSGEIASRVSGNRIEFQTNEQDMLIAAKISPGGEELLLKLDSAANSMVLFAGKIKIPTKAMLETGVRLATNTGAANAVRARIESLKIGVRTYYDLEAALPPASGNEGLRTEDGLLPTSLFTRVYINNREGSVVLDCKLEK